MTKTALGLPDKNPALEPLCARGRADVGSVGGGAPGGGGATPSAVAGTGTGVTMGSESIPGIARFGVGIPGP